MWTARWGHATAVINQTLPRDDFTEEENSLLAGSSLAKLVVLGGDDYVTDEYKGLFTTAQLSNKAAGGQLRNDIWWTLQPSGSESFWSDGSLLSSAMKWYQSNEGKTAPKNWPSNKSRVLSYIDWIQCQEVFNTSNYFDHLCEEPKELCYEDVNIPGCQPQAVWKRDNMWSPRRGHSSFSINGRLFVIGGRAKEVIDVNASSNVGGILDSSNMRRSDFHSEAVLKNDVWVSDDGLGKRWRLVSAGCQDHQLDILLNTEVRNTTEAFQIGTATSRCDSSDDCFGAAECREIGVEKTCVCPMFSPREHHTVVVQSRYSPGKRFKENYIFVIGGFTNIRKSFCGEQICGNSPSYRQALNDVWVSTDGITWLQISPINFNDSVFRPRGAHASIVTYDKHKRNDQLWIFGGETSSPDQKKTQYLADVWYANLQTYPCCAINSTCPDLGANLHQDYVGKCIPNKLEWIRVQNKEWPGRSGHVVVYEPPLSRNSFQHHIYLIGGKNSDGILSDVWSWNFKSSWRKDFNRDQWYRSTIEGRIHFGPSNKDVPALLDASPHRLYLAGDTQLSDFVRTQIPHLSAKEIMSNYTRPKYEQYFSPEELNILESNGIHNLYDLATVDLYTLLKFRGYDFPGKEKVVVRQICEALSISRAFLNKCALENFDAKEGRNRMFSKFASFNSTPVQMVFGEIYHVNIIDSCNNSECASTTWDGCSPIQNKIMVNVNGIGNVPVPRYRFDPYEEIQDIHCRSVPQGRSFAAAEFFNNQIFLLGGRSSTVHRPLQDVWIRDDDFPQASISIRPRQKSKDSTFFFESNKDGAQSFEYKIIDVTERSEVTSWISTGAEKVDVSWLDDKKGGPGKGLYALYVRSIDPSGNRDYRFTTKSNIHLWDYNPPLPWTSIISITLSGVTFFLLVNFEYRRRKRKAAMERYAIRRMRRNFKAKAFSKGLGNITDEEWRAMYFHSNKSRNGHEEDEFVQVKERKNVSWIRLCVKSY